MYFHYMSALLYFNWDNILLSLGIMGSVVAVFYVVLECLDKTFANCCERKTAVIPTAQNISNEEITNIVDSPSYVIQVRVVNVDTNDN